MMAPSPLPLESPEQYQDMDLESVGVAASSDSGVGGGDEDEDVEDPSISSGHHSSVYSKSGGDGTTSDSAGADNNKDKLQLAKEETAAITRLRVLVIKVLLLAALAVSITVYTITKKAEEDEYKQQYESAAKLMTAAFTDIMVSKMGVVSSLGVALIAHGVDHTRQWPFVTLSSFQQRASTALHQSGAIYLHINPLVTNGTRREWEQFVVGEDSSWM